MKAEGARANNHRQHLPCRTRFSGKSSSDWTVDVVKMKRSEPLLFHSLNTDWAENSEPIRAGRGSFLELTVMTVRERSTMTSGGRSFQIAWWGLILTLATVHHALPGPEEQVSAVTAARRQLERLNGLIGEWRGIGQVRRGSNQGAWKQTSEFVWDFSQESPAIRYVVADGRLAREARSVRRDRTGSRAAVVFRSGILWLTGTLLPALKFTVSVQFTLCQALEPWKYRRPLFCPAFMIRHDHRVRSRFHR